MIRNISKRYTRNVQKMRHSVRTNPSAKRNIRRRKQRALKLQLRGI